MPTLDRFESIFRSSIREVYTHTPVTLERATLVTDMLPEPSRVYLGHLKAAIPALRAASWEVIDATCYDTVEGLLACLDLTPPDLIATYRNLHTRDKVWPHSLGTYLDVMAQVTPMPVLALPHPTADGDPEVALRPVQEVLVVTDHLIGSDRLINLATALLPADGRLMLAHVEDSAVYERYLTIISKLPEINTDYARAAIRERLLREPRDYIESCRRALADAGLLSADRVVGEVRMGHRVADFQALIAAHHVDLVVFNVQDREQLAMHDVAYPLAIALRDLPVLMV